MNEFYIPKYDFEHLDVRFAFPRKVREVIKRRAGGVSELSGSGDRPLHAAHIRHGSTDSREGVLTTDIEHLALHDMIEREGLQQESGLTKVEAKSATNGLYGSVGSETQADELQERFNEATELLEDIAENLGGGNVLDGLEELVKSKMLF